MDVHRDDSLSPTAIQFSSSVLLLSPMPSPRLLFAIYLNPAVVLLFSVFVAGQGDVKLLKQWTGEVCFNKLAAEAKQRKADGMVLVSITNTMFLPLGLMLSISEEPVYDSLPF